MKKRINIVSVKLVKEAGIFYAARRITGPEDVADLVRDFLEDADREIFLVICLNAKNEPTAIHTVAVGTLNSVQVHPREVFKAAILANSYNIVLVHNHPSGDPQPSKEDMAITKNLAEAGRIVGISVLDHIIIGDGKFASLKTKGLI